MIRLVISDLSELLNSGMVGIETELEPVLGIAQKTSCHDLVGTCLRLCF